MDVRARLFSLAVTSADAAAGRYGNLLLVSAGARDCMHACMSLLISFPQVFQPGRLRKTNEIADSMMVGKGKVFEWPCLPSTFLFFFCASLSFSLISLSIRSFSEEDHSF